MKEQDFSFVGNLSLLQTLHFSRQTLMPYNNICPAVINIRWGENIIIYAALEAVLTSSRQLKKKNILKAGEY